MTVGRPTKYTKEMPKRALEFIGSGKSVTQFAKEVGVAKSSIYEWADVHPEFSDALKQAQEHSQAVWEDKLESMMYSKEVNAPLVKLYFANRFRWHDRPEEKEKTGGAEEVAEALRNIADKLPG